MLGAVTNWGEGVEAEHGDNALVCLLLAMQRVDLMWREDSFQSEVGYFGDTIILSGSGCLKQCLFRGLAVSEEYVWRRGMVTLMVYSVRAVLAAGRDGLETASSWKH